MKAPKANVRRGLGRLLILAACAYWLIALAVSGAAYREATRAPPFNPSAPYTVEDGGGTGRAIIQRLRAEAIATAQERARAANRAAAARTFWLDMGMWGLAFLALSVGGLAIGWVARGFKADEIQ